MNNRFLFQQYLAPTSDFPLMLEIEKAEGIFLYASDGKRYYDIISGISVSNIGHCNPYVVSSIQKQTQNYLHLMVYGEYVQSPQVKLAQKIISVLPDSLEKVYFVNSGSEAIEGAIKLARRFTGRSDLISFRNSYHGSSIGALSIMGNEDYKRKFRPLMPCCHIAEFNDFSVINQINSNTACVVMETIQAEAGIIIPNDNFLSAIRKKCNETGTLLIFDEIQTGIGRTGKMFAFEHWGIAPDILVLAKAFGGGMPLGAFISSSKIMNAFTSNPVLGHITTFGGHPVCCAASLASIEVILSDGLIAEVNPKMQLFIEKLSAIDCCTIRAFGLLIALDFGSFEKTKKVIDVCLKNGVITDWFLFNSQSLRIAPPLTITQEQISEVCDIIIHSVKEALY